MSWKEKIICSAIPLPPKRIIKDISNITTNNSRFSTYWQQYQSTFINEGIATQRTTARKLHFIGYWSWRPIIIFYGVQQCIFLLRCRRVNFEDIMYNLLRDFQLSSNLLISSKIVILIIIIHILTFCYYLCFYWFYEYIDMHI